MERMAERIRTIRMIRSDHLGAEEMARARMPRVVLLALRPRNSEFRSPRRLKPRNKELTMAKKSAPKGQLGDWLEEVPEVVQNAADEFDKAHVAKGKASGKLNTAKEVLI
jgi:hypothetical protein